MSGRTHAVIGANAVWLAVLLGAVDERVLLLLFAGVIGGLLPDIDATRAKIHFVGGGALGAFRGIFEHRGFFHSIFATVVIFVLSFVFLRQFHFLLPYIITLGYASHLFIDGFNFKGTRYLFPSKKKMHVVPKWLASPVGGITDHLLLIFGLAGIVLFFLTQMDLFAIPVFNSDNFIL